jgi:sugar phosphate isomerase/epimerase
LPAAAGKTAPVGVEFTDDGWNKAVQTEWEYAVDGTRELARYARARSITLAIEPLNRYESFLVTDLVKAKQFVHDVDVDNLKIHLDTFHMNIEEKDLAEVVFEAGDLLVSMHLSDSNRETPGCGHTDFSGIMESLQKISFQGYLVLEPVPPGSNPPFDAARPSAHYYRDIYAKEGIDYLRKLELKLKDGG